MRNGITGDMRLGFTYLQHLAALHCMGDMTPCLHTSEPDREVVQPHSITDYVRLWFIHSQYLAAVHVQGSNHGWHKWRPSATQSATET